MSIDLLNFNPRFSLTDYVGLRKLFTLLSAIFPRERKVGGLAEFLGWRKNEFVHAVCIN